MAQATNRARRRRVGARQRSEALLRDLLSADEHLRLVERGYLEVPSRDLQRVYHIQRGGGFVTVLEQGEPVELLCIGPAERLPPADVLIMHKLLIEADEETYLRMANHLSLGFGDWRAENGHTRLTVTPWVDW